MKDKFIKNGVFSLEYDKETLRDMVLELQEENQELKIQVSSREEVANKYKEVIDKVSSQIKLYGKYNGEKCTRGFSMMSADFNKLIEILKGVE